MYPLLDHSALYAAFDVYPSSKGAATHIARMARTLFDLMGGGLLYVLGAPDLPAYQREGEVEILRYSRAVPNLLERGIAFGRRLSRVLDERGAALDVCHFRDPWSGGPLLARERRAYATIYEVNGLPSIELPYAYPMVAPRTLEKIREIERRCWSEADRVITPSRTIRDNLVALGAPSERITVIPNGADLAVPGARPAGAPGSYLIYVGALQAWQGVDVLLRAFAAAIRNFRLTLDMRGPFWRSKHQPSAGRDTYGCKEDFYEDPWLLVATRLADGATLRLRIVDRVRKRTSRRVNARGKTKTKTKYKTKRRMQVALGLRGARYAGPTGELPGGTTVTVKRKAARDVARFASYSNWREVPGLEFVPDVRDVIDLIATGYRAAEPGEGPES